MRGSWAGWLSAGLCGVLLCTPARAQEAPPPKSPTEPLQQPAAAPAVVTPLPVAEEPVGFPIWQIVAPRLSAGYTSGPGVGYSNGFSQINAFVPIFGASYEHLFYVDVRGIASDNNFHWGNNLGTGYRYYSASENRIYGIWSAFDTRDTGFTTFTQMSGGVETIGRYLDFRSNGYVITGPQVSVTNSYFINAPFFFGTNILAPKVINTDSALTGLDGEVGGPVPLLERYGVRAFGGAYAFHGEKVGFFGGGQGRLEARISNNVDFNLQVRGDQVFGATFTVGGAIRWGGVRRAYREPDRQSVYNRMADPVQRNYNVSVANHKDEYFPKLTDPNTGQPIVVIHVNNLAPPGGDGSVEHPINTLAPGPGLAGNFGYILVDKGDGTTNGMNQGATLFTGQHLFGNSMQFPFISNELGIGRLPVVVTGAPNITNVNAAPVVVLASGSEVAGFNIAAPNGNAISGTGINNFSIHDLTITSSNGTAINLTGVSGVGLVNNVTESGSTADGLSVTTTGGSTLTLGVTGSTFTANAARGINLNSSGSSSLTTSVNNGTITNNGTQGILAQSSGASSQSLTVQNSTISGNGNNPVLAILSGSGTQSVALSGNTITSSNGPAVSVTENSTGTLSFSESNDTITTSGLNGIAVSQTANSSNTATASVSGNTVTGATNAGIAGIDITQTAPSSGALSATVSNNTSSSNNLGIALTQTATGSASVTSSVTGNTASSSTGGSGIIIDALASGGGAISQTVTGNTASNNAANGLAITATGNGSVTSTVSSNTASSNATNGIALMFSATGASLGSGTVSSNTVGGNGTNGIFISSIGIGTFTVNSNTTTNNDNPGINIANTGAYTYNLTSNSLTNDNVTGSTTTSGGFLATNGTSNLTLNMTSNTSAPFGGFGYFFANGAGTYTVNFNSGNNTGTTGSSGTVTIN